MPPFHRSHKIRLTTQTIRPATIRIITIAALARSRRSSICGNLLADALTRVDGPKVVGHLIAWRAIQPRTRTPNARPIVPPALQEFGLSRPIARTNQDFPTNALAARSDNPHRLNAKTAQVSVYTVSTVTAIDAPDDTLLASLTVGPRSWARRGGLGGCRPESL